MKHFAKRFDITVEQVTSLRRLINKAADAQENEHNTGDTANVECDAADSFAALLGIRLDWNPGLYPLCIKGELSEHIPEGDTHEIS